MVPIGGIVMWAGLYEDIPSNYLICDGENGTPSLVEKFIYGSAPGEDPGETGGSSSHSHTPISVLVADEGVETPVWSGVYSENANHIPPYFKLAFIQRMS